MSNISNNDANVDRIIDYTELRRLVDMSISHLNRIENEGIFPKRIKIGKRKIGWSLHEVIAWMEHQKDSRHIQDHKKEV